MQPQPPADIDYLVAAAEALVQGHSADNTQLSWALAQALQAVSEGTLDDGEARATLAVLILGGAPTSAILDLLMVRDDFLAADLLRAMAARVETLETVAAPTPPQPDPYVSGRPPVPGQAPASSVPPPVAPQSAPPASPPPVAPRPAPPTGAAPSVKPPKKQAKPTVRQRNV